MNNIQKLALGLIAVILVTVITAFTLRKSEPQRFGDSTSLGSLILTDAATSTAAGGWNISAGCFAISGTCVGQSTGTVNTGTTGQVPYYAAGGTTLTATSTLSISTASFVGVGTASPTIALDVTGVAMGLNRTGASSLQLNNGGSNPKLQFFSSAAYTGNLWGIGQDTVNNGLSIFGTTTNFANLNAGNSRIYINNTGVTIGNLAPTSDLQVATSTANATSTLTLGKTSQTKGSCFALFDQAGTAVYFSVAPGATSFTGSATSCK